MGSVIPNPKLKLMDHVREVLRLKDYAMRTEQCTFRGFFPLSFFPPPPYV